jgi:UDP-sulfoquinovose synthase
VLAAPDAACVAPIGAQGAAAISLPSKRNNKALQHARRGRFMRVCILGGDGYLGWPTAMYLANQGHDVSLIDNLAKRAWEAKCGVRPLKPLPSLFERVKAWNHLAATTGRKPLRAVAVDIANGYPALVAEFANFRPDTIIHYAEQPSAPYSMSSQETAVETQRNNVLGTLNVLFAMRENCPDAHLVKLGTLGEYGTPNIDIEEGFIEIEHNGRSDYLPFPKLPGSYYHLSKVHDSHNIHFACRIRGLRATDLNQGVVYGIQTEETALDERLVTRFDYDDVFGTALNRFCLQAVIGHPLTVYGKGGQTRGYLNIVDTLRCVELAVAHPAETGEYRVFNQFTEQFSILQLAEHVQKAGAEVGIDVTIDPIDNPRVEAEEHYYNATHTKLLDLGLQPHLLSETLIGSMFSTITRYRDRVILDHILPQDRWRPGVAAPTA